jgi:predicted RND superfamily exporter protein
MARSLVRKTYGPPAADLSSFRPKLMRLLERLAERLEETEDLVPVSSVVVALAQVYAVLRKLDGDTSTSYEEAALARDDE